MTMMHTNEAGSGLVTRGGQIAARDLLKPYNIPSILPCSLSSVEDAFVVNERIKDGSVIGGIPMVLMSPELPRYLAKSRMSAPIVIIAGYELLKPGCLSDCYDELDEMGVKCEIPFAQGVRFLDHAGLKLLTIGREIVFRTTDDEGKPLTVSFCRSENWLYVSRIAKAHKSRLKTGEVVLTM